MNYNYSPRNYRRLVEYVMKKGVTRDVGGNKTKELIGFNFRVQNPRDRIVTDRARRMNLPFGVAEWLSWLFNINDIAFFATYISGYKKYSSDGKTLDGAYGPRIWRFDKYQLGNIIEKLKVDPSSRRAVVSIYDGSQDLFDRDSKGIPCTLTWQFLIREEKLHMIVNMRSNDLVWGLTYDLFGFTLIQEWVANKLASQGVRLGSYYHHAGSFHIYERHFSLCSQLGRDYRWAFLMSSMPPDNENVALQHLLDVYRYPLEFTIEEVRKTGMPQWHQDLALAAMCFVRRRSVKEAIKNNREGKKLYYTIENSTIRHTMSPFVKDMKFANGTM